MTEAKLQAKRLYRQKNLLKIRSQERAWYAKNREKRITKSREWNIKNPEKRAKYKIKNRQSNRRYKLRIKYNLTQEAYNTMYMEQLGLCAICHNPFGDEIPYVDHCHKTNKVRGLVHRQCNLLLGHAKDSIQLLEFAINYLKKSQ